MPESINNNNDTKADITEIVPVLLYAICHLPSTTSGFPVVAGPHCSLRATQDTYIP